MLDKTARLTSVIGQSETRSGSMQMCCWMAAALQGEFDEWVTPAALGEHRTGSSQHRHERSGLGRSAVVPAARARPLRRPAQ